MESLIADFVQFSCAIANFFFGGGGGGGAGGGYWSLGYVWAQFWELPEISLFPKILSLQKSPVVRQLMRHLVVQQLVKHLVHSTFGDNNLGPFHLR